MAYKPTLWESGKEYGPEAFNNIENGIVALEKSTSKGMNILQTLNMGKAMQKLRNGSPTSFCFLGDSVLYAFYRAEGAIEEDCIPDKGPSYSERYGAMPTRNPVTIHDEFLKHMQTVYGNTITKVAKVYSGHTAKWAYEDYNASGNDICIINFGINDAMGAHVPSEYKGDLTQYVDYMRKLIDRELENGTAVAVMTPVKQTLNIEGSDTDDRTMIDIYEQVTIAIAKEYNCPLIDCNEMTKNFGVDLSVDFTHFTAEGNSTIGARIASYFIGQGPDAGNVVSSIKYIGVNPQVDNVNIVGSTFLTTDPLSPNNTAMLASSDLSANIIRIDEGLKATAKKNATDKVIWSFYSELEESVIIPSFLTKSDGVAVKVKSNFGTIQGSTLNYWQKANAIESIDRTIKEPSSVDILLSDMIAGADSTKRYDLSLIGVDSPVLKITGKGWHTVEISLTDAPEVKSVPPQPGQEAKLDVFGITVLSPLEFKLYMLGK